MAKKGLGRGFESLLPLDSLDDAFDPTSQQDSRVSQLRELKLSEVHANPDQPRRTFDQAALEELALSVKEHGVVQPIIVSPDGDGYQIVAGERRYRAATIAGLDTIPAIVRSLGDQNKLEISLIENIQRENLNPIETATAYVKLRDQFNLTFEQIGERVHKTAGAVTNTTRLLRLPKEVQQAVAEGKLSEGQARPLAGQAEDLILELYPRIIEEGWTTHKVEQYLTNLKIMFSRRGAQARQEVVPDQTHEKHIVGLRERLNTDVDIKVNSRGAGKITIKFKSQEELERLEKLLEAS